MTERLPEWLFEGRITIYTLLAVCLVFLLFVWKQTPRKGYLVACVVLLALIGLYFLLDVLVQTDKEQITHAFREMSAGVQTRNIDRIFANVSDTYNRHGMNKSAFKAAADGVIRGRQVDEVKVWAFEFEPDYKRKESAADERENLAKVSFMAKPVASDGISIYRVEAVMHRDSDGKWRMQSWDVFDPYRNETRPLGVPGVP